MSRLARLMSRVESWWFDEVAIQPLVICRIGLGLMLFHCYTVYFSPRLDVVFGPEGLGSYLSGKPWVASSDLVFRSVFTVAVVSSFTFAVGLGTRVSGLLLIISHYQLLQTGALATWGWKWMIFPFLNCLILAPSGAAFSVDAWWQMKCRPGWQARSTCAAWPFRLIQLHVAMVYVGAAWQRMDDANWLNGSMVYEAMTNLIFGRFPYVDWNEWKLVLAAMTYGAFVLEVAAPLLLWHRRLGPWVVLGLVAMHLGLEILTMTGYWHVMLIIVLVSFMPVDLSKRTIARLERWGRGLNALVRTGSRRTGEGPPRREAA